MCVLSISSAFFHSNLDDDSRITSLSSSNVLGSAKSSIYVGCQDAVLYALNFDEVSSQLEPSNMSGMSIIFTSRPTISVYTTHTRHCTNMQYACEIIYPLST